MVVVCFSNISSSLPLLSAIRTDPELSILAAVMAGMGTSPQVPDPQLEERFNSKLDGRNYTFFAPTNAVSLSCNILAFYQHFKGVVEL
jgi:hypothetical protein